MKISLVNKTEGAKELLIFSKRTRHLNSLSAYHDVLMMEDDEKRKELEYVFNTISSSWEFVDYVFLIEDVTRAFTHQLVRHRVGVAFAQQAQRVADMSDFGFLATGNITDTLELNEIYLDTMIEIKDGYRALLARGANPQDARGVLPTNILTNILMKVNLRALSGMCEVRLCVRAQGEFQRAAREMRKKVLEIHPWAEPVLRPFCLMYGACRFPAFENCPLKGKYPHLFGKPVASNHQVYRDWEQLMGVHEPQPEAHSIGKEEDHGQA